MDKPINIVNEIWTAQPKLRALLSSGAMVTLSDGKHYIDIMNGKGSVTLGHHHPAVSTAVLLHLERNEGSASCWSDLHETLANKIIQDLSVNNARLAFFSTGTEACRAAIQAARRFTGGRLIASAGYHGWGDDWARSEKFLCPNKSNVVDFYFVPELLEQILVHNRGDVALVMLSPDYIHLQPKTLQRLANIARQEGVLLCCDDVKQGYRSVRASKFQEVVGFHADLYTFAKGLANGYRLSCLVGRSDVMASAKDVTYTAYFDTVPIVASLATLSFMDDCAGYSKLNECGTVLAKEMRCAIQRCEIPIEIYGDGVFLQIVGATEALDDLLYKNCAKQGLLLYEGDSQAVSLSTFDVMDELLSRFEKALLDTSRQLPKRFPNYISRQRRFQAAFRMIDGASDVVPAEDALAWIKEMR